MRYNAIRGMEIRFATKELEDLYVSEKGANRYPTEVVDAFFDLVTLISEAPDERDLRALKGAHFEKLPGRNTFSMRLNRKWRLEIVFEASKSREKTVVLIRISNHYGD